MRQDAEVPPRRLKGKKYIKNALLIIDEVGFQPLSRQEASLLFRLVSWRYQRGSTVRECQEFRVWASISS